jgi:hypothetical protein
MYNLYLMPLLLLFLPLLSFGQTMVIENTSGSSQTYNLTDVRSIKFTSSDMLVNLNSGSTDNFSIQDVDLYRIDLTDDSTNSINELSKEMTFVLYPNPASGSLNISLADFQEGTVEIAITDISGRLIDNIFSGHSNGNMKITWEYHDKNIPTGTYFCMIKSNSGMISKPITLK